jgi:hypothetical protein
MKLMPVRQSLTSKHCVSSYTELSQKKDTEIDRTQEVSQAGYCRTSMYIKSTLQLTHITSENQILWKEKVIALKIINYRNIYGFIVVEVIKLWNNQLNSFFNLDAKMEVKRSTSRPGHSIPGKEHQYRIQARWTSDPTDDTKNSKISAPEGFWNPDPPRSLITIPIKLSGLPGLPD